MAILQMVMKLIPPADWAVRILLLGDVGHVVVHAVAVLIVEEVRREVLHLNKHGERFRARTS